MATGPQRTGRFRPELPPAPNADTPTNLVTDPPGGAAPEAEIPQPSQYFVLRVPVLWAPLLIVFVGFMAVLAAIGGDTIAHHYIGDQASIIRASASPTVSLSAPAGDTGKADPIPSPSPSYDLEGFQTAVNSPQEHGLSAALTKLSADAASSNLLSAGADVPAVTAAVTAWRAILKPTNPPPAYQSAKRGYMKAMRLASKGAWTIRRGLRTGTLSFITGGGNYLAQAQRLLPSSGS